MPLYSLSAHTDVCTSFCFLPNGAVGGGEAAGEERETVLSISRDERLAAKPHLRRDESYG